LVPSVLWVGVYVFTGWLEPGYVGRHPGIAATLVFGPPIALGILLGGLYWIVTGFRR
jgi:hypothetical protein